MWDSVVALVRGHGLALATALAFVSTNPARAFGLDGARVGCAWAATPICSYLTGDLRIRHVWARGRHLVRDGRPFVRSMFEPTGARAADAPGSDRPGG